jgi:hypothetical protein
LQSGRNPEGSQPVNRKRDLTSGSTTVTFLKSEPKGRKFLVDIRTYGVAGLVPAMGEEAMKNYACRIKEQEPIWVRGNTRAKCRNTIPACARQPRTY